MSLPYIVKHSDSVPQLPQPHFLHPCPFPIAPIYHILTPFLEQTVQNCMWYRQNDMLPSNLASVWKSSLVHFFCLFLERPRPVCIYPKLEKNQTGPSKTGLRQFFAVLELVFNWTFRILWHGSFIVQHFSFNMSSRIWTYIKNCCIMTINRYIYFLDFFYSFLHILVNFRPKNITLGLFWRAFEWLQKTSLLRPVFLRFLVIENW